MRLVKNDILVLILQWALYSFRPLFLVLGDKKQSGMADFAPWQTGRNIRIVCDSGPYFPLYENMTSYT